MQNICVPGMLCFILPNKRALAPTLIVPVVILGLMVYPEPNISKLASIIY